MKKTLLYTMLGLGGLTFSFGQTPLESLNNLTLKEIFHDQPEVVFSFQVDKKSEINRLTKIVSIDTFDPITLEVRAYANEKQFELFLKEQIAYTILPSPSKVSEVKMWDYNSKSSAGPCNGTWDAYPTYDAYVQLMNDYAAQYPDICELINIGSTYNGKDLLVLKITDNLDVAEDEPQFLYTSTMHGDETSGYVLMLRLIDHLLCNYGSDQEVTNIINNIELYINPLANPDGAYRWSDNSVAGATRSNAQNIDLNRNYPDPEDGAHPDGESYQLETTAFMNFASSKHFVISANLHSGAEVVNFPWDTWGTDHADLDWWEHVSYEFANNAQSDSPNGYFTYLSGATNGFDWYEVDGGRQDYMNYEQRCREFTLEMSDDKTPNASDLPDLWDYNQQAFMDYMMQSLYGIRGIVTDSITGEPLEAHILILDHDFNNSDVYSHLPVGNYHRPIYEGTYTIVASADGYTSKTIENVQVINNETTRLDIQLGQPLATTNNYEIELQTLQLYPNPSSGEVQFIINNLRGNDFQIQIMDLSGKVLEVQTVNNNVNRNHRKMNLSHLPKGVYFVSVQTMNGIITKKLIME